MPDLLAKIERAAVRGWPALETQDVDGWLCRHTSGGSVRANSVAALAFTGHDFATAIDRVEAFYRARNTKAVFSVSDVAQPAGLDSALARRGYTRSGSHVTMAKAVAPPDAIGVAGISVAIADAPSAGWCAVYLSGLSQDRRSIAGRILARLPPSARYFSATHDGKVVTSGLSIVDGRLASVQCMASDTAHRRMGGARAVLAAIERHASLAGARNLYLQTSGDNAAAQELYASGGYAIAGRYHTRTEPR